jgi:hypothetical protein
MERFIHAVGVRGSIGLAAAAALYACGALAPTDPGATDRGVVHPHTGALSLTLHHWTGYGSSDALACLGGPTQSRAVEQSVPAMRLAKVAALAAHADPDAAMHAAARTSLVATARRASTSTSCREAIIRDVRLEYAAATAFLPDRPSACLGAALGAAAASRAAHEQDTAEGPEVAASMPATPDRSDR